MSEALLDLAAASLQHCGFHPGDFELQLLEHGLNGQPILLVQVRKASELVWDFSSHLETYLLDRMYRRGGFRLERIMFTPTRMAGLNLHDARNGVRVAWTSLTRTRHDAADDGELNLTDRAGPNPASAFAANDTHT